MGGRVVPGTRPPGNSSDAPNSQRISRRWGWDVLLQRLDKGTFDVYGFLKTLDELGYTGPILLQGYKVGGTPHEKLEASIGAWRKFSARLAEERK